MIDLQADSHYTSRRYDGGLRGEPEQPPEAQYPRAATPGRHHHQHSQGPEESLGVCGSAALKRAPDPVMRSSNSMPCASAALRAETSTSTSLPFRIDVAVIHAYSRLCTELPVSSPCRTNSKVLTLSFRYICIGVYPGFRTASSRAYFGRESSSSTFVSIWCSPSRGGRLAFAGWQLADCRWFEMKPGRKARHAPPSRDWRRHLPTSGTGGGRR